MQLSARNQFSGQVKEVKLGNIMAEVVVDIGGGHESSPRSPVAQPSD
jgi:molybdopterin-binding protein